MDLIEILNRYNRLVLRHEVGPWDDSGRGTTLDVVFDGVPTQIPGSDMTADVVDQLLASIEDTQRLADKLGKKVILSVEGWHQGLGNNHRQAISTCWPRIKATFRIPKSVTITLEAKGILSLTEQTAELADQAVAAWAVRQRLRWYEWAKGIVTSDLVPDPPEGHSLLVIQIEGPNPRPNRPFEEEFFVAFKEKTFVYVKNGVEHSSTKMESLVMKGQGGSFDVTLPDDARVLVGHYWMVARSPEWWLTGRKL